MENCRMERGGRTQQEIRAMIKKGEGLGSIRIRQGMDVEEERIATANRPSSFQSIQRGIGC